MRPFIVILLLTGLFSGYIQAEKSNPYAPAAPYFLSTDEATYFHSDHLTGASYFAFSPDGRYLEISKEHMGVWPTDDGTWTQAEDGVITLVSTNTCADILCGPLKIGVYRRKNHAKLSELRNQIEQLLISNPQDTYSRDNLKELNTGKYALQVDIVYESQRKTITSDELKDLGIAIDRYLAEQVIQHRQFVPLEYKGVVFLIYLNTMTNRGHAGVCHNLDKGVEPGNISYYPFKISEEKFNQGTEKPYPFKHYPHMNKLTGAE